MAEIKADILRKRSTAAWAKKDQWRSLYEEAYEYALPQRNLFDGNWEGGLGGRSKGLKVFDSTAIHSTQRFANRIQSGLFPPDKQWMVLAPGTDIPPPQKPEVAGALQTHGDKFFSILRQTSFDLAMGEFLMDMCVGTGAMLIQPGDDLQPIRFDAVPIYLLALEEGPNGNVENVFRKMRLMGDAITRQWPDAEIPDSLAQQIEDKPSEMVNLEEATVIDVEDGGYGYYVTWKGGDDSEAQVLVYRKLKMSPWVISRFMKVAGETYGRGPLISALPDIKTLNKTLELLLKNASINIAGVYTAVDDGVLNTQTVRIVPGAVLPVARNGGPQGPSLMPLPRSGDVQLSQIIIQDLRLNIKRVMLDDSLPPDSASARSATEIVERMRELATNLGSAFGRLITETMVPIVRRSLFIMDEKGLINLPLKVNGLEVGIVPVSPLAQAQNLDEIQDVMQWLGITTQMGPTGIATVNMEAVADFIGDKLGVPQELRTTNDERAETEELVGQYLATQAGQPAPEGGVGGA